jgi:hypothetical protein
MLKEFLVTTDAFLYFQINIIVCCPFYLRHSRIHNNHFLLVTYYNICILGLETHTNYHTENTENLYLIQINYNI